MCRQANRCSGADAIRADRSANAIASWADAYNSYRKFARCDDASIGEGYSDKIARLLSDKWSKVAELDRLAARDKGFERFVLRHVDELMTDEQAKKIRENAQKQCPPKMDRLCKAIITGMRETDPRTAPK